MQKVQAQVNIRDLKDIICNICGGRDFIGVANLKYVSPLQSPSGKEEQAIIPAGFACLNCRTKNSFSILEEKKQSSPLLFSVAGSGTVTKEEG